MDKYKLAAHFYELKDVCTLEELKNNARHEGYTDKQIKNTISIYHEIVKYHNNKDKKLKLKLLGFGKYILFIGIGLIIFDFFMNYLIYQMHENYYFAISYLLNISYSMAFLTLMYKTASYNKKNVYHIGVNPNNVFNFSLIKDVWFKIFKGSQSANKHDQYLVIYIRTFWIFILYMSFRFNI